MKLPVPAATPAIRSACSWFRRLLLLAALAACPWVGQAATTTTVQQAYVKASNTGMGDIFGTAVAISGETMVIGAPYEASDAKGVNGLQQSEDAPYSGAVYVFVRSGGQWVQQAYLKASNAEVADCFGWSVAISGDTIVVGAFGESSSATGVNGNQDDDGAFCAGAAYVFARSGSNWVQQAYLKASNTDAEDYFGTSVAVSGDIVVVGAEEEDSAAAGVNGNQSDNYAGSAGAAYVFARSGTNWTQQAYLKGNTEVGGDYFGGTVTVSGTTVVVGAPRQEDSAGAAHVFVRQGTTWSRQAVLKASNSGLWDRFACSVALSGDTLVVGAFGEDSQATGVNGTQSDNSVMSSGAAYVFVRSGSTWQQQAYLKASNTGSGGQNSDALFGYSVAVSSNSVLIGAPNEPSAATGVNGSQADASAYGAGAAYWFARSGTTWSQQAYLKASNTGAGDGFGFTVALSGGTMLIGAYYEDGAATGINGDSSSNGSESAGAAYVFGAGSVISAPATLTIAPHASTGQVIRVTGEPNVPYLLQRAPTVAGPWGTLVTLSTGPSGLGEYHDSTPPSSQSFYRTVKP